MADSSLSWDISKGNSGRLTLPTLTYMLWHLKYIWLKRNEVPIKIRDGFASYFYIAMATYIEHFLFHVIKCRVQATLDHVHLAEFPNIQVMSIDDCVPTTNTNVFKDTLINVLEDQLDGASSTTIPVLEKLYERYFSVKLKSVIGDELRDDWTALSKMRNIFAHGNDIHIDHIKGKINLDNNPIQTAVNRLKKANIITDMSGNTAIRQLYTDEALLYFYECALGFHQKLKESCNSDLERMLIDAAPSLPDLYWDNGDCG